MKCKKVPAPAQVFADRIRALEERLFGAELQGEARVKSGRSFWHFRPSHHIATGLLTPEDVTLLSAPGKRLLSVGAYPAFLERLLPELGVPPANILLADKEPAIATCGGSIPTMTFDVNDPWPQIGTFDRIIFPESLCIAISDRMKMRGMTKIDDTAHPTDALEASLLAAILRQSLARLRPGGIIRANGPMSHPKVFEVMSGELRKEGLTFVIDYQRFFLLVRTDEKK
ncbi:MAG: hypothetical protein PHE68_03605 [Candidatus Peribacteraceae bacterium]|nr:hypothetical protein [Candidatus Peribacteraceae bacterium]MDD5074693.1 hypothetical protein [Candidatus Peribacteraceae bacterium]